ncbi:MAG: hypothetical protein HQ472_05225 [Ignavibacteria bacterium]|nr:hypothetical protein [Ignavibacteria bacterium]
MMFFDDDDEATANIQQQVVKHVSRVFDLDFDEAEGEIVNTDTYERIRAELVSRIIELLNTNVEKLFAVLYRIDVTEEKVNEVFNKALPPDVPDMLADLIMERQIQKARSRKEHKP